MFVKNLMQGNVIHVLGAAKPLVDFLGIGKHENV